MNAILKWIALIFVHILLPIGHLYSDIHLIADLLDKDEWTYAYWMLGVYAIPGVLQAINWILTGCMGETSCGQFWFWILFSIFFPFSVVIWNIGHACLGPNHFKQDSVKSQSKVLNSISTLTKSPLQMLIQTTIIALEWHKEDGFQHTYQGVSMLIHGLILVYDLTDNYFFQVTGKGQEEYVSYKVALRITFCNIFHLPVRMMIFSFLMMYGRTNFFVSVGLVLAFSNLLLAFIILRTKPYKNFFTAFGAIVLPGAIFFSKDSFHSRKDTQQRFQTFSYWNSLTFLLVVTVALVVRLVLFIKVPDFFEFTCETLPPFAYSPHCNQNSLVYDIFGDDFPGHPHGGYLWASSFTWLLAAVQTGVTMVETRCF